jgi:hypothetical protein
MQQRVCWGQSTELKSHWRIVLVENLNFFILLNFNPNSVTKLVVAHASAVIIPQKMGIMTPPLSLD